jgi:hypothetical protein
MDRATILALRIVIALALAGSVVVQAMIVPAIWLDLVGAPLGIRITVVTIVFLGVFTIQVFAVCVWMLLAKVRRGSVFSESSFVYVHVIGEAAPGIVGLVGGAGLVLGGMALLVVVMKALLRQAIEREREAKALRAELDEVV